MQEKTLMEVLPVGTSLSVIENGWGLRATLRPSGKWGVKVEAYGRGHGSSDYSEELDHECLTTLVEQIKKADPPVAWYFCISAEDNPLPVEGSFASTLDEVPAKGRESRLCYSQRWGNPPPTPESIMKEWKESRDRRRAV